MNLKQIQHLYWRAAFGINPKSLQGLATSSKMDVVDNLIKESQLVVPLGINTSYFNGLTAQDVNKSVDRRREIVKKSREKLKEFNLEWLYRMTNSKAQLRERMTLFWACHFVCEDNNNILHFQRYNNTLREYALGDFREFVKAISKEASMIKYLNFRQNKANAPNENFSRELMELFTLGLRQYSNEDIKEASKAFTGYNFDFQGEFIFENNSHDDGFKYFFGKSGHYDGDDIIDIILDQKQCAKFICEKIYTYFVNENLVDAHIDDMVSVFFPNYNIEQLMRFVFMSDWFYNAENMGTKIKSPTELLVGIQRVVPISYNNPLELIKIQRMLGQLLLQPPNVAGWQGGRAWITSNTILFRLKTPSLLLNNGLISAKNKADFNDRYSEVYKKRVKKQFFKVSANWEYFEKTYRNMSFSTLKEFLIQGEINVETELLIDELSHTSIQDSCIQLMSLPEYQMC